MKMGNVNHYFLHTDNVWSNFRSNRNHRGFRLQTLFQTYVHQVNLFTRVTCSDLLNHLALCSPLLSFMLPHDRSTIDPEVRLPW